MSGNIGLIGAAGVLLLQGLDHNDNAGLAPTETLGRLAASVEGMGAMQQMTLAVGSGEHREQLLCDAGKVFSTLESELLPNPEDPFGRVPDQVQTLSTGTNVQARDKAEMAMQQQQAGVRGWLSHALGNMLTPAAAWFSSPPGLEAQGQDMGMGWSGGLLSSLVLLGCSKGASAPVEAPKPLTAAQKNAARLQELNGQIDERLHKLDVQLKGLGAATEHLHAPVRRNAEPLDFYGNAQHYNYTARGYLSAAVPFLKKLAMGAGATTAAMAVAPWVGSLLGAGIQATAALFGMYGVAKSVQSFPGEAAELGAEALIKTVYGQLDVLLTEQKNLLEQESARTTQSLRIEGSLEMRKLHIFQLRAELVQLAQVGKPELVAVSNDPSSTPRHPVDVGSGAPRAQVLGVVARAREAFAAFFAPVGRGLASVGRFITSLPSLPGRLLDRRAAAQQEQAYMDNLLQVLGARRDNSLVGVVGPGTMVRAEGARSVLKDVEIDAQLRMGENLVRALQEESSGNHGRVLYKPEGSAMGHAVSASIATARAIAWYAEAMAHAPAGTGGLASKVARNADGSMTVSDPDLKFFSFLRSVPTAYAEGNGPPVIRIDDPRKGMPGGMQGMQFKLLLDGEGKTQLHLSFTTTRGTPVFQPLANESEVLFSAQKALYRAESGQLKLPRPDFSHLTPEDCKARSLNTQARLQEQEALQQKEMQQLEKVADWSDPEFQLGVLSSVQPPMAENTQRG